MILSGPTIYTEEGLQQHAEMTIENGLIAALKPVPTTRNKSTEKLFSYPSNYHILPGFIDMHVHGANGHDVMDAKLSALAEISQTLAAEGTTSYLATTMTAEVDAIEKALTVVRHYMEDEEQVGATILGVHLEGPFLAVKKMGAQPGDKIIAPDIGLMQHWQQCADNIIKLVTLAPEAKNCLELIQYLTQQNIIASIGHTNASYVETVAAIIAGCTHATHLFNAMRGIHHREPGAVTAALLAETVTAELIVDGIHLHPAIVSLVFKAKGKDKIVLITDSMRAKCLHDGEYDLGGQTVSVREDEARLSDGTLAGSVLKMSSAIVNMLKFSGCDLLDIIRMTAENPAKALGIFQQKGSIAVGKDADVIVLDENLNVVLTVCRGKIAYQK